MRSYRALFLLFTVCVFMIAPVYGEDQITLTICSEINKKIPGEITPVSVLKDHPLYTIYGHIKMVSNSEDVEHHKYYLEWIYHDGTQEILLDNYVSNKKWLVYDRRVGHINDYYWVNKIIFGDNTGEYFFRLYIKKDGKYIKKAETSVTVEK